MTEQDFYQLPDFIKIPACEIMSITGCNKEDALLCVNAGLSIDKSVELINMAKSMNNSHFQITHIDLMYLIQSYTSNNTKVRLKELIPLFGNKEAEQKFFRHQRKNDWKQRIKNLQNKQ